MTQQPSEQKTAFTYQPEVLKLRWPIKDDKDQPLTELTLKPIFHAGHAEAIKDQPDNPEDWDERIVFGRFAALSCGLSVTEIKRLKRPDWNSLCRKLSDLVGQRSAFFFKAAGQSFDPDSPQLLVPIEGDDGQMITRLELEVPAVETTDLMEKQADGDARNQFICMACTKRSMDELNKLSQPDWNQLQGRLNDFLNKAADFFPAATSSN